MVPSLAVVGPACLPVERRIHRERREEESGCRLIAHAHAALKGTRSEGLERFSHLTVDVVVAFSFPFPRFSNRIHQGPVPPINPIHTTQTQQ